MPSFVYWEWNDIYWEWNDMHLFSLFMSFRNWFHPKYPLYCYVTALFFLFPILVHWSLKTSRSLKPKTAYVPVAEPLHRQRAPCPTTTQALPTISSLTIMNMKITKLNPKCWRTWKKAEPTLSFKTIPELCSTIASGMMPWKSWSFKAFKKEADDVAAVLLKEGRDCVPESVKNLVHQRVLEFVEKSQDYEWLEWALMMGTFYMRL